MENLLALLIVVVLVVALVSGGIAIYNRLVFLNNNTDKAFANIDVLLKQRADEIPNLIEVVKQHTGFEQSVLEKLTKLRTDFLSATNSDDKVALANETASTLKTVFAVSENYPQLQSSQAFNNLQQRVSSIEDAIADRRELFNETVALYNTGIQEFPNVLFAGMLRYNKRNFLQITEQEKVYNGVKF